MVARPLRNTDPGNVHLISCRTLGSELLMIPNSKLNEVIGGVLARYQEEYCVDIYDGIVLSNHYHLLVQAPERALPQFVENINREIAHRTNRFLNRRGIFWGRRYDDLITLEETDALAGLLYIATNAVKHSLVSHPRHWPGLKLYDQVLGANPREYSFLKHSEYHRAKKQAAAYGEFVRKRDYESRHTLKVSPLPIFADLSPEARQNKLRELIEEKTTALVKKRRAEGKGFIGRKAILSQPKRGSFPAEVNTSPRPSCYTKNPAAATDFRETEQRRRAQYVEASVKFRSGNYEAKFPPFCLRPPSHHVPKTLPRNQLVEHW